MLSMLLLLSLLLPPSIEAQERITIDDNTPGWVYAVVSVTVVTGLVWFYFNHEQLSQPPKPYLNAFPEEYLFNPAQHREFKTLGGNLLAQTEYIESFWKAHDPTPHSIRNENREDFIDAIEYLNETFIEPKRLGWQTDRGRTYLQYGKPDQVQVVNFTKSSNADQLQAIELRKPTKTDFSNNFTPSRDMDNQSKFYQTENVDRIIWYYNRPAGGNHLPLTYAEYSAGGMFVVFDNQSLYGHYKQIFSTELSYEMGHN